MGEVISDSRTVYRALLSPALEMELGARLWEQKASRVPWQSAAGKGGDRTVLNLDMTVDPQFILMVLPRF